MADQTPQGAAENEAPKTPQERVRALKKRVAKMGRPPLISWDLILVVTESVRHGNYLETAAASAGVDRSTLHRWLKRGRRELQRVAADEDARLAKDEALYAHFCNAVEVAQAEAEELDLARLEIAGVTDWRAFAWKLERRHPARWRLRTTQEVTGANGEPLLPVQAFRSMLQDAMRGEDDAELLAELASDLEQLDDDGPADDED